MQRDIQGLEALASQIIAKHGDGRAADLKKYDGRILDFVEQELHWKPYPKQIEVLLSFEQRKKTCVRGCHGAGKDAVLGVIALYAALVKGMLVLVISATERQLLGQTWRELSDRFRGSRLPGDLYAADFRIKGEKRIIAMTSANSSNLTGWHDKHGVCVLVSESQAEQVEAAAYDALDANTIDDLSKAVVVGNPLSPEGRFADINCSPNWNAIQISAHDHPNLTSEGGVEIAGAPTLAWVKEMADEYGADSDWYRSRVLGDFPTVGIETLIKRPWIENANKLWRDGTFLTRVSQLTPYVVADIARKGADLNCIGVIRGNQKHAVLDELKTDSEEDLMITAQTLVNQSRELGFVRIGRVHPTPEDVIRAQVPVVIDDSGVGGGATDRARQLKATVIPFNSAWESTVTDPRTGEKKFANSRAEAFFAVRDALRDGRLALPPDKKLEEELLTIQFTTNAQGRFIVEKKAEIKKRLRRSPDRADTAAMAAWAVVNHGRHQARMLTYSI